MKTDRSQLIAILQHEMLTNTQWVRIHAAEGLLDNGESGSIAELFRSEADSASGPYRIGVWRILARATSGDEQLIYIEKIRAVLRDPQASNRIEAAESLDKINAAIRADRGVILNWLTTADDATAPFLRWYLVLTSMAPERGNDEAALANLLSSHDPIARLRAAFALGRLKDISASSIAKLHAQLKVEPAESSARVYLITALLLQAKDAATIAMCEQQLIPYLNGTPGEQREVCLVTGLRNQSEGLMLLKPLLNNSNPDVRVSAATGMLRLLKK